MSKLREFFQKYEILYEGQFAKPVLMSRDDEVHARGFFALRHISAPNLFFAIQLGLFFLRMELKGEFADSEIKGIAIKVDSHRTLTSSADSEMPSGFTFY